MANHFGLGHDLVSVNVDLNTAPAFTNSSTLQRGGYIFFVGHGQSLLKKIQKAVNLNILLNIKTSMVNLLKTSISDSAGVHGH